MEQDALFLENGILGVISVDFYAMNDIFLRLKQEVLDLHDSATERTYYRSLCNFFEEYAVSYIKKMGTPIATVEESVASQEEKIGFPDITVRDGNRLVGWIEVKSPEENLVAEKFNEQFDKYKDSLENIIFTNLREWQLWQWSEGESEMVSNLIFDLTSLEIENLSDFEKLLQLFFEGRAYKTRTPKQLAFALAKKTRFLSKQVEEAFESGEKAGALQDIKDAFEHTLIQDITVHQFSNMFAETMAYSLFLAALEHVQRGNQNELSLGNASEYLPINVPVLSDLYGLVNKVAKTIPNIYSATRLLVDQLNASDIESVRKKLVEHKPGEDPVLQFYEPFLKEYDPAEREARGVYYTPKPVVDYIIRSVDKILRKSFKKEKGLADESVNILDPATGTGTFLMSAIQQIYSNIEEKYNSLGSAIVTKEFNNIVLKHILKHFFGFELLIAPYAITHLKLTLELERLGFDFTLTYDDGDPTNDRFQVYLANTLDNPSKAPEKLVGFNSIPQESENARKVKSDVPLIAIIGNPPYSISSMNPGEWIENLIGDYKKNLEGEQNLNALSDDYIKFIRFSQWRIARTGQGVFAMITNGSLLDGVIHRTMRHSLLETFDELYIYNLHGSSRRGEACPDGSPDENVFDIQQGVSINIFIKYAEKKDSTVLKYCDLWGSRKHKFETLIGEKFEETNWTVLSPEAPYWFFVPKDPAFNEEYYRYACVKDFFLKEGSGIKFRKDNLLIKNHFSKDNVVEMLQDINNNEVDILQKYNFKETKDWKLSEKKKWFLNWDDSDVIRVNYRPFDYRYTYYPIETISKIIVRGDSRVSLMRNMILPNLGLITRRTAENTRTWQQVFVSSTPIDINFLSAQTYIHPLYLYDSEKSQLSLHNESNNSTGRSPNLSDEYIQKLADKIGLTFIMDGQGDLSNNFGPEDIFYYNYAILFSPSFRERYQEQLKIDFPYIPLFADKKVFQELVILGKEFVYLHLLGETPFGNENGIFDKPSDWHIKVGGEQVDKERDWHVDEVKYSGNEHRVYINEHQYIEKVEAAVWEFYIGGYQVCEKWLKDRQKLDRALTSQELKHYLKIIVGIRETIRLMEQVDKVLPEWPSVE